MPNGGEVGMTVPFLPSTVIPDGEAPLDFAFGLLQSSTEYSMIGKDLDGRILLWNEGAKRIYGYAPEEVVGKSADILHVPEDVATGVPREMLKTALAAGKWEGSLERLRKDGRPFPAPPLGTLRHDAKRKPTGFLLISRVLSTERR